MTCEAPADWRAPPACGKPATGLIRVGCVHEHIHSAPVCAECATDILREDGWECLACAESAEPHVCSVDPEYVPHEWGPR